MPGLRWSYGWLAITLSPGLSACGPEVLEPRDPTPGVPHFKVATYNVYSRMEDDPATLAAVGATGADIVCLQEVTPAWREALRSSYSDDYPYMLFEEDPGNRGLAVLSRYPLTGSELQFVRDWHPAWHVSAQTPAGWLQLLNVHLRSNFSGNGGRVFAEPQPLHELSHSAALVLPANSVLVFAR